MASLALIVLPALLLIAGVPIFVAVIAAASVGILAFGIGTMAPVHLALFGSLDSFPLLAVPLFILAGDIMARGGIARRVIELVLSVVGGIRGSLAVATVGSAVIFGAMSGSSVACVAAIGKLTLGSLKKNGYGERFSVSLITATGVIDVLIPPSIPMILYAVTAQQSVTTLFLAGIVPGLLVALVLAIYVLIWAHFKRVQATAKLQWTNVWRSARESFWALLAPVVILGGIYGGVFTPTEAAGAACVYAILVSRFIYREMTWRQLWETAVDSARVCSQILIIVSAAGAYSWLITTSGFPSKLVAAIGSYGLETWSLLLMINVLLLFVGSILEPPAAILILTPLLAPLAYQAGVNPIHFGIIVTMNLAIGMFMPPFGLNVFASHALFGVNLMSLYRGVLPFLVLYLMVLVLITYVPAVTLAPLSLLR